MPPRGAVGLRASTASDAARTASPQRSLAAQLRASSRFSSEATHATSPALGAAAAAAAAACLATFAALEARIAAAVKANGFTGAPSSVGVFDTRYGYTAAEVETTLGAWGPRGAHVYYVIEVLDAAVYCPAYRAACVVGVNALARLAARRAAHIVPRSLLAFLLRVPVAVALLDQLENVGQVGLTLWHELSAGAAPRAHATAWRAIAAASSAVNVAKWSLAGAGSALIAAVLLACAVGGGGGGTARPVEAKRSKR
jgi:hypothetical protein